MEPKTFTIIVFALVVVISLLQAVYSERFGQFGVRMIAAAPRPVQAFYAWASFGHPYDGAFWNRVRRWLSATVGVLFVSRIRA